jgi:hypothetical protein
VTEALPFTISDIGEVSYSSSGMRSYARKLLSAGWSIRIPHFSQNARSGGASVTVTLYLAPHSHLCVPLSHSTNSVMIGLCAADGEFSKAATASCPIHPIGGDRQRGQLRRNSADAPFRRGH